MLHVTLFIFKIYNFANFMFGCSFYFTKAHHPIKETLKTKIMLKKCIFLEIKILKLLSRFNCSKMFLFFFFKTFFYHFQTNLISIFLLSKKFTFFLRLILMNNNTLTMNAKIVLFCSFLFRSHFQNCLTEARLAAKT